MNSLRKLLPIFISIFLPLSLFAMGWGSVDDELSEREKLIHYSEKLKSEDSHSKRQELIQEIENLQQAVKNNQGIPENIIEQTYSNVLSRYKDVPEIDDQKNSDGALCRALCQLISNRNSYKSAQAKGPMGTKSLRASVEGIKLNFYEELVDVDPCGLHQLKDKLSESSILQDWACMQDLDKYNPVINEHQRLIADVTKVLNEMAPSDSHSRLREKDGKNNVVQGEVYQKIHMILSLKKRIEQNPNNERQLEILERLEHELGLDQKATSRRYSGGWGSLMNSYASSVAMISHREESALQQMELKAEELRQRNRTMRVPYNLSRGPERSERAASARNTTFYMGLYFRADNGRERYRDRFVESIEVYNENLNSLMAHMLRDGAHIGADSLGSYYFYSTFPYVTSGIKMLLNDPSISDEQKKSLKNMQKNLKDKILDIFNDENGVFEKSGWYSYNGSASWINPLLGIGLLPLIEECSGKDVDSYGIIPKSLVEEVSQSPLYCVHEDQLFEVHYANRECPEGASFAKLKDLKKFWNAPKRRVSLDDFSNYLRLKSSDKKVSLPGEAILSNSPSMHPALEDSQEHKCVKIEDLVPDDIEVSDQARERLQSFVDQLNGNSCP